MHRVALLPISYGPVIAILELCIDPIYCSVMAAIVSTTGSGGMALLRWQSVGANTLADPFNHSHPPYSPVYQNLGSQGIDPETPSGALLCKRFMLRTAPCLVAAPIVPF